MEEVSGVDVIDGYNDTALMYRSGRTDGKSIDELSYLLTYKPPPQMSIRKIVVMMDGHLWYVKKKERKEYIGNYIGNYIGITQRIT